MLRRAARAVGFQVLKGTVSGEAPQESYGSICLEDIDQLEEAILTVGARLVVIDPLQSFLGAGVDRHRSNQTRPVMDGLIRLAERHLCAILILRHLSKGQGANALYRGLGSIDITAAARSELFAAPDPRDPTCRVLAHSKSNIGKLADSLTYTIRDDGPLIWGDTTALNANDLLVENYGQRPRAEAEEFLEDILANGPRPSEEVKKQAQDLGISLSTLRRAQTNLKVISRPAGFGEVGR